MSEDINIGAISEALNEKADRDINNLTTGGYTKGSSLGMPSNRYIDLTLGAAKSSYIAPANGWLLLSKNTTDVNQFVAMGRANIAYCNIKIYQPLSGGSINAMFPYSKGQSMYVDYNAGGTVNAFRFIYAEGSQLQD